MLLCSNSSRSPGQLLALCPALCSRTDFVNQLCVRALNRVWCFPDASLQYSPNLRHFVNDHLGDFVSAGDFLRQSGGEDGNFAAL